MGVPVKTAKEGETVSTIAEENFVKDRHIRKWNDLPADAEIEPGDIVFLKPKRRRATVEKHTVAKGENMHEISQQYGIKLKQLYKKNRMESGTEPQEGEVLYMRKKRSSDDLVEVAEKKTDWAEEKEEVFVNPHSFPKKVIDSTDFSNPGALNKVDIKVPEFHTVEKGDNIYRIAEKYHVLEEDLLAWNSDLNPSAMRIGQKIYLTKKAADANGTASKEVKEVNDAALKTKKDIEKASKEVVGRRTSHACSSERRYTIQYLQAI